jgi:hypothetical protein
MAKVLRLCSGGGVVVEGSGLTIVHARSLAIHLMSVGEPAGCCWCVGVWDDEAEEAASQTAFLENKRSTPLLTSYQQRRGDKKQRVALWPTAR